MKSPQLFFLFFSRIRHLDLFSEITEMFLSHSEGKDKTVTIMKKINKSPKIEGNESALMDMRGSRWCNFDNLFPLVEEGRDDPSTTISGPSLARQRNAIKWRFAGVPMIAQH